MHPKIIVLQRIGTFRPEPVHDGVDDRLVLIDRDGVGRVLAISQIIPEELIHMLGVQYAICRIAHFVSCA